MAERDIIRHMIAAPGQDRRSRLLKELSVHFADIDERSASDFLLLAKRLAEIINFHDIDPLTPAGEWSRFFDYDEGEANRLPESDSGEIPPHLALFISFLKLYEKPKEVLNRFSGRHLDFYYRDVLRFGKKPPEGDKAHLLIELKKNVAAVEIGPEHLFSAGKDAKGGGLLYAPVRNTIINASRIVSLRSVHIDKSGMLLVAQVADSSDGVGGALKGPEPKWPPFGSSVWPKAEIGFAMASPVLRMKEGSRRIILKLTLSGAEKLSGTASLAKVLDVRLTGEKQWIITTIASASCTNNILSLDLRIGAKEQAVVDCDPAIHQFSCLPPAPVVQVGLKQAEGLGYGEFSGVKVIDAELTVEVGREVPEGDVSVRVRSLHLETDLGIADPKKPFLPFGPLPVVGSRFSVTFPEAAEKNVSSLDLTVKWKGVPDDLGKNYCAYGRNEVNNNFFTASVFVRDCAGTDLPLPGPVKLFESITSNPRTFIFDRSGPVTFSLTNDFFHSAYRNVYAEAAIALAKAPQMSAEQRALKESGTVEIDAAKQQGFVCPVLPNEPYTPTIDEISLSYTATSGKVAISSILEEDCKNEGIRFFHVACFGIAREHGYLRNRAGFIDKEAMSVSLLPEYADEGQLFIGLANLHPGDSVSVLFQVAKGSNDPDLKSQPVGWSVLCNNYWKPLSQTEVLLDSTSNLLGSGIITFIIPAEATLLNTLLPSGFLWIRGGVAENAGATCHLIEIAANAVEVKFRDNGNDLAHLSAPLPAGTITKLKTPVSAIKAVKQPYASFGGAPEESDADFHARVSERLRHKNRCITPWDYERIVLDAFPNIHMAKCIPHANEGSWLAPGNVLLVVVPDLRNNNAADPLGPKVDADTISRIASCLRARTGLHVRVAVKNPTYQKIELDFKVRFRDGYEFNYYSKELKASLTRFLSPWAFESEKEINFGGRIYKSVLLDFVEEVDYVDFVTDFKMFTYTMERSTTDIDVAQPERPDAILVSAGSHSISEV
ncbi:MAG: baseplate J/gp47 family protein [Geobacter sp.]|nr:baseplate J/gp47 family protein [Geobacter sp.]